MELVLALSLKKKPTVFPCGCMDDVTSVINAARLYGHSQVIVKDTVSEVEELKKIVAGIAVDEEEFTFVVKKIDNFIFRVDVYCKG
ncbi:hypothetical protein L0Y59_03545 [Candidatus Uhrbacteria bacterium]|nr:hypothetical protein [Candidatus Uhrbacteria bacterium]